MTRPRRLAAPLAALVLGASACGGLNSNSAPPASLPPGCHGGTAKDLQSTLAIVTDPANCPGSVNSYWASQLGSKWTPPTFVAYRDGERPQDACGLAATDPNEFADNAFFCPKDGTIAYSQDLLSSLYASGGPYLPAVVLMHEIGHRADAIAGTVGVISRSEENQADCLAGVTTAYARTAHRLPFKDVISAATLLFKLGDTRNFGSEIASSPDAHGTPSQRVIAFGRGYFQKISACRKLGRSSTGSTL